MPRKHLSPEDHALWARVIADVKPVRGRTAGISTATKQPVLLRRQEPNSPHRLRLAPEHKVSANTPPQNTLDANWDKRLTKGIVRPDYVIDLHEHTAAAAHLRLERGLSDAIADGARIVLLITGKARGPDNPRLPPTTRGVIRASVQDWIAGSMHNRAIAAIRNAHPRHGGAGALYLIMRRPR